MKKRTKRSGTKKSASKSLFGKVNTSHGDAWLKKFKNRKIKML